MENEIWKDIEGYPDYQVSNFGRVKSLKFNKEIILKDRISNKGYLFVLLYKEKESKSFSVHRLIANTFLGKSDLQVNHKNSIRTDNRLENLEYVSSRENNSYRFQKENLSSKYIGVCWDKNKKKWRAYINMNCSKKFLGYFINELDAYNAYIKALEENNLTNKYA
jgi:hypothetical protein